VYSGDPAELIPGAESPPTAPGDNPEHQGWQQPTEVRPKWEDFTIDGKLLFDECYAYLHEARQIVSCARKISRCVHGSDPLTRPPR
jgi:hypothetical protein